MMCPCARFFVAGLSSGLGRRQEGPGVSGLAPGLLWLLLLAV